VVVPKLAWPVAADGRWESPGGAKVVPGVNERPPASAEAVSASSKPTLVAIAIYDFPISLSLFPLLIKDALTLARSKSAQCGKSQSAFLVAMFFPLHVAPLRQVRLGRK
jgi:hypothetical protein